MIFLDVRHIPVKDKDETLSSALDIHYNLPLLLIFFRPVPGIVNAVTDITKSDDKNVTVRIRKAGELLEIRLSSTHLIISDGAYYSFLSTTHVTEGGRENSKLPSQPGGFS